MLHNQKYRFFALNEDDYDVKIFPGSGYIETVPKEDDGVAEYIKERDNGNLKKAKQAGEKMSSKLRKLWRPGDSARQHTQKKVLFAYAAAKSIENHCDSSVLSQSILSEFYRSVKEHSQSDYDLIQDSVAFTKFLLSERNSRESLGVVFAELCGEKDDPKLQSKGMLLFYRYYSDCLMILNKTTFQ